MPLLVKCSCGREMRVPDDYAGRRIKCRGCDTVLTVPDAEEAARPAPRGSASAAEMIRFSCEECGKAMQAKAEYAGRVTKCPNCGLQQAIPANEEEDEAPVAARIQAGRPAPRRQRDEDEGFQHRPAARRQRDDEDEEDDSLPVARRGRAEEDEDEEDRRPTRRRAADDRDKEDEDEDGDRRRKRGKKKKQGSKLLLILGLAAGLFLVLGTGTAVGLYFLFSGGSDLATWVPGDGQGFVSVRFAEAWKQDDTQKMLAEMRKQNQGQDPGQEIEKQLGLVPADIDRLTAVFQDVEKNRIWFVVSTVKAYDQEKLKGKLQGASEKTHENQKYLVGKMYSIPTNTALYCASRRTFVFGPEEGVKAALDVAAKRTKGPLDDGLALLGKPLVVGGFNLSPKASQALKEGMNDPFTKQFTGALIPAAEVQSGTVVMNAAGNNNADVELGLKYADDGKAKAGKEALDKGVKAAPGALLVLGAGMDPKTSASVNKLIENIKLEQSGTRVVVKFQVDLSVFANGAMMSGAGAGAEFGPQNPPVKGGPIKGGPIKGGPIKGGPIKGGKQR